jgi:hypothetical protein
MASSIRAVRAIGLLGVVAAFAALGGAAAAEDDGSAAALHGVWSIDHAATLGIDVEKLERGLRGLIDALPADNLKRRELEEELDRKMAEVRAQLERFVFVLTLREKTFTLRGEIPDRDKVSVAGDWRRDGGRSSSPSGP